MTVKQMAALGGNARAAQLTKARRQQIAATAAQARWKPKRKTATKAKK